MQIPPAAVRTYRRSAFTIVELIVTMTIILVLIGLSVKMIKKVRIASQGASTSAQLSVLQNAIQQYYSEHHAYPGPLDNSQINTSANAANANLPHVISNAGATINLTQVSPGPNVITGAENLVLGLLGGLQLTADANNPPDIATFVYDRSNIDPLAKGASSLKFAKPKRFTAYLEVKAGDLSAVGTSPFQDEATRSANDSNIPEFVDKFSQQMPILYLRANTGGKAIVGCAGKDNFSGTVLTDPNTNQTIVPQYDLKDIYAYTNSQIGTKANDMKYSHHGLVGIEAPANIGKSIDTNFADTTNPGFNALGYFADPSAALAANSTINTTGNGNSRQRDGYILISAGPDGIYGTSDDIIAPGSLNP